MTTTTTTTTTKNKQEDGENREDDADERREPAEKRSETEQASRDDGDAREAATTRWFFRLVDLTGGEGSDLPATPIRPRVTPSRRVPRESSCTPSRGGTWRWWDRTNSPGPTKGPTP